MTRVVDVDDIRKLGTILCVWAHPDDESFCCAGIMAAAIQNGQKVACITATKGEAGVQDESRWPAAQLGEIRANELTAACKILGLTEHHWLGYSDGGCAAVPDTEGAAKVREFIDMYHPSTILTFGPDGLTGHPDHQTVSRWASLAAQGTEIKIYHIVENEAAYEKYLKDLDKQFNIYFMIDKPPVRKKENCDIAFCLTPELAEKKFNALSAMPSQTEGMMKAIDPATLGEIFECECYVAANAKLV